MPIPPPSGEYLVPNEAAGLTLAAFLRTQHADLSWSQARAVIQRRLVRINGGLTLDGARRLNAGDVVRIGDPAAAPKAPAPVSVIFVDRWLAVVEKPVDILTERRKEERNWPASKKALQPSVVEQTAEILARQLADHPHAERQPRPMYPVHRLDRETSGLMVIARTPNVQAKLIEQFRRREVRRVYWAAVLGRFEGGTIRSWIHRDRGDGLRGSGPRRPGAVEAITHVDLIEHRSTITICECRLETGRTNQIRIHLAESGHLVCGEKKYNRRPDGSFIPDDSGCPRLALHSRLLQFEHPITGETVSWESKLPESLGRWLEQVE